MSLLTKRCSNCDAPRDQYGRNGGHSWCESCINEEIEAERVSLLGLTAEQLSDPMKRKAA